MFIAVDRPADKRAKQPRRRWTFRLVTSPLAGLVVLVETQEGENLKVTWTPWINKGRMPTVPQDVAAEALQAMRDGLALHLL